MAKKRSSLKSNRPKAEGKTNPKLKTRPKYGVKANSTFKKGNHSMNPDRKPTGEHQRSRATINRLRMYKNFKPVRDRTGHIIKAAPFQEWLKSGTVARVEPNRKWFGNTKVIGQDQLQKFQENLGKVLADPFQVVMKQTKLPISLLQEKAKQQRVHVVDTESFEHTFGKKALRKKPKLTVDSFEAMSNDITNRVTNYKQETDRALQVNGAEESRLENPNPLFRAGQSNRVWGELYKVLDSSDVVVEVIDARDPMGTRCRHVEEFLRREKPHKHLVIVMNKVDLVPTWVTRKWLTELSKEVPTIAFHASMQHSFGKGSLINLLRQFASLHKDLQQISVGFIGYPNVGKSSIVNTLRKKKVCKTAPLAGETKVWQYVTLMRRIYLIDCPGVVYPQGDTETQIILKGVVRVENVRDPENHVQGVLDRVKAEHLSRHYDIEEGWADSEDFMSRIAIKTGRLLKGGEPDIGSVAKVILNDFQRGRLPYFVAPPGCEERVKTDTDEAPINELCADEDEKEVEEESENGDHDEAMEDTSGTSSLKEGEDDELTDVGSTCSGLSDLSGVSDLEEDLEEMEDEGLPGEEEGSKKKSKASKVERRRVRGKRAGKKQKEKKQRMLGKGFSIVEAAANAGNGEKVVEFGLKGDKKKNMWRKKLEKRRKIKHQVHRIRLSQLFIAMSNVEGLVSEVSSLLASRLAIRAGDAAFFGGTPTASNASTSQLGAAIGNARAIVDNALQTTTGPTKALLDDVKAIKEGQQKILAELAALRKLLEHGGVTPAAAAQAATTGKAPAPAKKEDPKKEEAGDDEDFDLFGSDDEEESEEKKRITEERLKAYAEKKAKKAGPIAKSSVILDVKPWDDETDLGEMEKLVRSIELDGLVWGGGKLIPIGYGIQKLQIIAVIEDDKVSVDDLIETITGDFESHVQSVDIVAFNKI